MDFGIAKAEGAQNLTMDRIVGTPVYMSAEQASGKPVDLRTDIYSLGMLMYALLAGSAPFDDPRANPMEVIMKQVSQTPDLLSSRAPEVPERLVELIHRMVSKSPDERPQDMNEVLEELKVIEAKPESGFARTFRRHRRLFPFHAPTHLPGAPSPPTWSSWNSCSPASHSSRANDSELGYCCFHSASPCSLRPTRLRRVRSCA
jgi:serine/threonine protein kinase